MRFTDDRDGATAQRWGDDPQADPHGGQFGPQGEALILELQRLRHAFEEENGPARKSRGPKRGSTDAKRQQRKPPPQAQAQEEPGEPGHRRLPATNRPQGAARRAASANRSQPARRQAPTFDQEMQAATAPHEPKHRARRSACDGSRQARAGTSRPVRAGFVARPRDRQTCIASPAEAPDRRRKTRHDRPHRRDGGRQLRRQRQRHGPPRRRQPLAQDKLGVRARITHGLAHPAGRGRARPAAGSSSCRLPAPSWCPAISWSSPTSRPIQHPTGGVVAEIKVQNGSRVARGRPPDTARRDAGAGEPADGEQAARRVPRQDRAPLRRARRLPQLKFASELAARAKDETVK